MTRSGFLSIVQAKKELKRDRFLKLTNDVIPCSRFFDPVNPLAVINGWDENEYRRRESSKSSTKPTTGKSGDENFKNRAFSGKLRQKGPEPTSQPMPGDDGTIRFPVSGARSTAPFK